MFDIDLPYYLTNLQISFLVMNIIAGFYFVMTRTVDWTSLSEAATMERQGKYLLMFCMVIALINALEKGGGTIGGWLVVMLLQFATGAIFGIAIDKYRRL